MPIGDVICGFVFLPYPVTGYHDGAGLFLKRSTLPTMPG